MGGEVEVALTHTPEEITSRLIELGRNAQIPNPHTVYVVENPALTRFYQDRSELDNICYALPVGHLKKLPFPILRLVRENITFYPYKYHKEALEDAKGRLARLGRQ